MIQERSQDGHSYKLLTESGHLTSRNRIHLRPTNMNSEKLVKPFISNDKTNKPVIPSMGKPAPVVKVYEKLMKSNSTPNSTANTAKCNGDQYRMRSHIMKKPLVLPHCEMNIYILCHLHAM